MAHTGIFISYRRSDTGAFARLLTSGLQDHFPVHDVFRDLNYRNGIDPGEDFAWRIESELEKAGVIVILIGTTWVDEFARRSGGTDPDFVLRELETALSLDKNIIPVLAGRAEMPAKSALPPGLARIPNLQSLRLTDEHFDTELVRVVRAVRKALGIPEEEDASTSALDQRLLEAAAEGQLKSVKLLVRQGANLNARNEEGATPLILAAANGHTRTVSALCELGAKVDATTKHDVSALLAAIMHPKEPNPLVIRALLDMGASIELASDSGVTPLLAACDRGDYDVVTFLLENGANPNVEDDNRSFPSQKWILNATRAGVPANLVREVAVRLRKDKASQ